MNYCEIGQKIRKYRKAKKLSQEKLAELVNISVTHLSHIETGNTKLIAEAIQATVKNQELVYIGEPTENIDADIYFVGSWIDKGSSVKPIGDFLGTLDGKKIAIFATAGFGGSEEYYEMLFQRIKAQISETNDVLGRFFCQGKDAIPYIDFPPVS